MHSTALTQQSNETCDGLDSLIENRFAGLTGNCTRNDNCNQVNCVPGDSQSIRITFPESPDSSCSVRTQATLQEISFDETVTESRVVNVPVAPSIEVAISFGVNFSPVGNVDSLQFGVSFNPK